MTDEDIERSREAEKIELRVTLLQGFRELRAQVALLNEEAVRLTGPERAEQRFSERIKTTQGKLSEIESRWRANFPGEPIE